MQETKKKEFTNRELINMQLAEIRSDITEKDRAIFIKEFGWSRPKLSMYLNNKIMDDDEGIKLLSFMTGMVAERKKTILSLTHQKN